MLSCRIRRVGLFVGPNGSRQRWLTIGVGGLELAKRKDVLSLEHPPEVSVSLPEYRSGVAVSTIFDAEARQREGERPGMDGLGSESSKRYITLSNGRVRVVVLLITEPRVCTDFRPGRVFTKNRERPRCLGIILECSFRSLAGKDRLDFRGRWWESTFGLGLGSAGNWELTKNVPSRAKISRKTGL